MRARSPEMVAVHRGLLQEAPLFPLDQEILELARVLIAPGANPERASPRRGAYRGGVSREV